MRLKERVINYNSIVYMDFETCSRRSKSTQPTQISACVIHSRKLEIVQGGIFNSYIKPEFDKEKQKLYGLDDIEQEALNITKIKVEDLEKAPIPKVVWEEFCNFVNQFNYKKTRWTSPILAGYNNNNFDDKIIERLCGGNSIYNECEKEPYGFGPWNKEFKTEELFHPIHNIDLMKIMFTYMENCKDTRSVSFDKMREKFGMQTEGAHNSLVDVVQGAMLLIKFLKLQRSTYDKIKDKFSNSFIEENKTIAKIISNHS